MHNKPNDVFYCNVSRNKIANAHPVINHDRLKIFHYYLHERYMIHLKKDVYHESSPWTDDPILSRYRFTQVRRELDRCSRWLINNISTNNRLSISDKIYNTLLFRFYNVVDVGNALQLPVEFTNNDTWFDTCISRLDNYTSTKWFTRAYKSVGHVKSFCKKYNLDYTTQRQYGPLFMIRDLIENSTLVRDILNATNTQLDVYLNLIKLYGIGSFLAYQLFIDLAYIPEFPFSENEFVVSGPGCSYGLHMLIDDSDGLTDDELLFYLRDNLASIFVENNLPYNPHELFSDLPEYDRYVNVMSMENLFCEFSKYIGKMNNPHKAMRVYQ